MGKSPRTLQFSNVQNRSTLASIIFLVFSTAVPAQQMSSSVSVENLMKAGHWKRARQLVEARLNANPRDAFALYLSSKVYASFGNLEKALDQAQKAVAMESRNPDFLSQAAEVHVRMADHVSVVKQVIYVRQFKKEVEAALAINPRHVDTLLVEIMFLARAPLLAGGDKKRANVLAQQLTQIDPGWGYLIQARLAELEGNNARTEQALCKAVETNPNGYLARQYLAQFYDRPSPKPRLDLAEKLSKDLIQAEPGQAGGYDVLAAVLAQQQRWPELEAVLAKAEAAVPDDLSPFYFAADALVVSAQDPARAERYLNKYLTQAPEGRQPTATQCSELRARNTGRLTSRFAVPRSRSATGWYTRALLHTADSTGYPSEVPA